MYLQSAEKVDPTTLVVLGGYTKFLAGGTSPQQDTPIPPFRMEIDWGNYLQNLEAKDTQCAHFETWGQQVDASGYGQIYFKVGPAQQRGDPSIHGIQITGGWTTIGDAGFQNQYTARVWGNSIKTTESLVIGRGRTFSDPPKSYDNAFSAINVWRL